jgi:hypothetical protein
MVFKKKQMQNQACDGEVEGNVAAPLRWEGNMECEGGRKD